MDSSSSVCQWWVMILNKIMGYNCFVYVREGNFTNEPYNLLMKICSFPKQINCTPGLFTTRTKQWIKKCVSIFNEIYTGIRWQNYSNTTAIANINPRCVCASIMNNQNIHSEQVKEKPWKIGTDAKTCSRLISGGTIFTKQSSPRSSQLGCSGVHLVDLV